MAFNGKCQRQIPYFSTENYSLKKNHRPHRFPSVLTESRIFYKRYTNIQRSKHSKWPIKKRLSGLNDIKSRLVGLNDTRQGFLIFDFYYSALNIWGAVWIFPYILSRKRMLSAQLYLKKTIRGRMKWYNYLQILPSCVYFTCKHLVLHYLKINMQICSQRKFT